MRLLRAAARSSLLVLAVRAGVALGAPPGPPADAPALRAIIATVGARYVDPARIDPQKMLWAAAAALDREIPEVLLESAPGDSRLVLRVAGARQAFEASSVRSLASLTSALREVLGFVDAHRHRADASAAEYAAIAGLLSTLDPHSTFLDPAAARQFSTQLASRISGVGMVMDARENPPVVRSLLKGGAAGEAGVAPCDRILAVDGWPSAGASIDELIDRIVGPVDTEVWISFERDGSPRELVLVRRQIDLSSVSSRMLDGEVGLIRIEHFSRRTADEVGAAVAELRRTGATAWVLDLRDNPGGLLEEALATASIFIPSGPLITIEGERGAEREVRKAEPRPDRFATGPLAVLVSEQTASSAEVLAAALQNRNRAVVLGRTSFGKGSIQVLIHQDDGSQLKLTVANYLTPGGASLQARGVVPDVELRPVPAPRPGRIRLAEPEASREAALGQAFAARVEERQAALSLRYLTVLPDHEEEIEIARELLQEPRPRTRAETIDFARSLVVVRSGVEEERIGRVLREAGVDWSAGLAGGSTKLAVRCVQRGLPDAEGRVTVDCDVRNDGREDAYRVVGRSPRAAFDLAQEEIVVGKIDAGAIRRVTLEAAPADDPEARVTYVSFTFSQAGGAPVEAAPVRIEVPARRHPTEGRAAVGPEIQMAGAVQETDAESIDLRATIVDRAEVRDAWIQISNETADLDRKKVAYLEGPSAGARQRLVVASPVPLAPGLNRISVCARGNDAEACETDFVFRRPAASD